MKKTLIALAVLATSGVSMAQTTTAQGVSASAVTIFGVLDARVNRLSSTNAGSLFRLDNSGQMSSRIGFRGTEDLGGGWGAAFWLEAGMSNDDGRGGNSTSNNTNMGQNLTVGTGNTAAGAQLLTPSTSGLGGLQGLTFNRAATVSLLNKDIGEFRLGRDYSASFWNLTVYDPFGTNGVGSALNVSLGTLNPAGASIAPPGTAKPQIRTSNSLGWLSSNIAGFRAQVQYGFSEVPSNCLGLGTVPAGNSTANSCVASAKDGQYAGFRLTYDQGPLSASVSMGRTNYAVSIDANALAQALGAGNAINQDGNVPFLGDYNVTNLGVAYDLRVAKIFGQWGTQEQKGFTSPYNANGVVGANAVTADAKLTHWLLGATVPMGNFTHRISYNSGTRKSLGAADRDQKQFAIGSVYNLSKRTSAYATYSRMSAGGVGATASMGLTSTAATAAAGVTATGFDIGVTHRF